MSALFLAHKRAAIVTFRKGLLWFPMNILIIGGSRNIGYFLVQRLVQEGHRVTMLNRGVTPEDLPADVARLRADRTDVQQMRRALAGRTFDAVVDCVMYNGEEAEAIIDILNGQINHYIFISSGQVYLVRQGLTRPFKEDDYAGELMPPPEINTYDYEEWLYGMEKRRAEDTFQRAYITHGFPYTALRLPMVNSTRDRFNRLLAYILRLQDNGPILVPQTPDYPLRHVYVGDVVEAIMRLINTGMGKGRAYNISQDETVSIESFLQLLGEIMGKQPDIHKVPRDVLEANGFLPDCSPYSELWMSELDNARSKAELGMTYTPLRDYLSTIVAYHQAHPPKKPRSYNRRKAEKQMAG